MIKNVDIRVKTLDTNIRGAQKRADKLAAFRFPTAQTIYGLGFVGGYEKDGQAFYSYAYSDKN